MLIEEDKEEGREAAAEEVGGGGVTAVAPWFFSERDVLDLMRLKKPLFLDSRFFSVASGTLMAEPLTEESLKVTESYKKIEPIKSHRR